MHINELSVFLSAIFIIAALSKLLQINEFKKTVIKLRVPKILVNITAFMLPVSELAVGLLILIESTRKSGYLGCLVLLLIFLFYNLTTLKKGAKVVCNCFGSFQQEWIGWATTLRILFFIFINIICMYTDNHPTNNPSFLSYSEIGAIMLFTLCAIHAYSLISIYLEHKKINSIH